MEQLTVTRARHTFSMATKIERKWVAERRPKVLEGGLDGTYLRQGYLAEDGVVTVRVRIADDSSKLTVKAGGGQARTEVEVDIDRRDAEELWSLTEGRRLTKTRYRVALDDELTAEVDVFDGQLAGLVIVEVEFESQDAAEAFDPPDWFGREVTGVEGWSNSELARAGRPEACSSGRSRCRQCGCRWCRSGTCGWACTSSRCTWAWPWRPTNSSGSASCRCPWCGSGWACSWSWVTAAWA